MPNTHVYEIVSNTDKKVVAHVWWDGKKVQCDNGNIFHELQDCMINQYHIDDGIKFIEALPHKYKNGYMVARPVKDK